MKKKVRWHTTLGDIEIVAQGFLRPKKSNLPSKRTLPLCEQLGIDHLKYSRRIRRFITDLGVEGSFGSTVIRMKEHHGVEVPESAVRKITLVMTERASELLSQEALEPRDAIAEQLVVEMDGVMVPVVEYEDSTDRRKTKELCWREMKIGVVQDPNKLDAKFACSFTGADALGDGMLKLLIGFIGEADCPLHGVGDGAFWIVEQGEKLGGSQYQHLIDYFHFCEYLYEAFDGHENKELMVSRCKKEAKGGDLQKVLRRLRRELKKDPDHEGVISCIRYIKNRPGQFQYNVAASKDLPIGSGLIESSNRSLIQKRLKLPGAWWLRENAATLAQLRVVRANGRWQELWENAA
jgi:hypothetical protein